MTIKELSLLLLTSGAFACGGSSTPDTTAAGNPCGGNMCGDPCAADPCGEKDPCEGNMCAGDGAIDWADYQSWTKVNSGDTFQSKHPKKPWASVYVTDLAAYKGNPTEGFAVVKAHHKGQGGDVANLLVMAKMGSDYDPDNGNWYYAIMSADASKTMKEGKIESCQDCHASGKDYLFADKIVGR